MTGKPRRPAGGARGSGRRSGAVEPTDGTLVWPGIVRRFAPVREGGPGRPLTLAIVAAAGAGMAYEGMRMVERDGIDGAGPALMLLGLFLLLFLALWLLVKAGLRGREVTFFLNDKGVGIRPSPRQRTLDRRMRFLAWLAFLPSWKGGQWSAWAPFTRWRDIRRVTLDEPRRQILIEGGPWDIRLACTPDNFARASAFLRERVDRHGIRALTQSQ